MNRNEFLVILKLSSSQTAVDNLTAQRVETIHQVIFKAGVKEYFQCIRTLIISVNADLWLRVNLQERTRNLITFHLYLMHGITEQRTARWANLVWLEARTTSPGEIFAGNPLWKEAHLPGADILVWTNDVSCSAESVELF